MRASVRRRWRGAGGLALAAAAIASPRVSHAEAAADGAAPLAPMADAPSMPEPGLPPSASDAPIELDVSLAGETRAERADTRARSRFEALVLFSAADGVGAGGQVRSGPFGARATLAYQPLLFLVDADPADKTFGAFEFSNSIQLNLDAMLVDPDTQKGGSLGYRFNDLLGHGISVAYQSMFDAWGQHFSLSFPVTYYPGATGRVRDKLGIASDYEINFPFGAGLQFGMGAAWIL